MATLSEIVATTISHYSKDLADNVTKNNAILTKLKMRGKIRPVPGGETITQSFAFAEVSAAGYYQGYEELNLTPNQTITAARYPYAQVYAPVLVNGLETAQNMAKEQVIDLVEGRRMVAQATMENLIARGLYSDGMVDGKAAIHGLQLQVPDDVDQNKDVGGINPLTYEWWRTKALSVDVTKVNIQEKLNELWLPLRRGTDKPDLIVGDDNMYTLYESSLQALQRFVDEEMAGAGFENIRYKSAPFVFDGGDGGFCPANHAYLLQCGKYLTYRPHSKVNMMAEKPIKIPNQDAHVVQVKWYGNLCRSGPRHGVLIDSTPGN